MKLSRKLMITSAVVAMSFAALPAVNALADSDYDTPMRQMNRDQDRGDWSRMGRGDCDGPMHGEFRDHHGKMGKFGGFGKFGPQRTTALTPEEGKLLIDAMLLRRGGNDLHTGDVSTGNSGQTIDVTIVNNAGDVVSRVSLDAFSGRPERGEFSQLRKMMGQQNKGARLERKFDTAQMETLAKAMVLMRGNGELQLGNLKETDRHTYLATITNKSGDVVREVELSRVTGRPIR